MGFKYSLIDADMILFVALVSVVFIAKLMMGLWLVLMEAMYANTLPRMLVLYLCLFSFVFLVPRCVYN